MPPNSTAVKSNTTRFVSPLPSGDVYEGEPLPVHAGDQAERVGYLDGRGGRPQRRAVIFPDLAERYDVGFKRGRRAARMAERINAGERHSSGGAGSP